MFENESITAPITATREVYHDWSASSPATLQIVQILWCETLWPYEGNVQYYTYGEKYSVTCIPAVWNIVVKSQKNFQKPFAVLFSPLTFASEVILLYLYLVNNWSAEALLQL